LRSPPVSENSDVVNTDDPATGGGDSQVLDQLGSVEDVVQPIVADEPIIEDTPVDLPAIETSPLQDLPVLVGP
jgi:hypothetical protein